MKRLPGYRWPVGMPQTRRNRRWRKPPAHFNPLPMFGLRVVEELVPAGYMRVSELAALYRRTIVSGANRHFRPLEFRDDDYIAFANARGESDE